MAKINAHGEIAHVTFEGEYGARVVLTKKRDLRPGRLLHKRNRDRSYEVVKRYAPGRQSPPLMEASTEAEKYATARGMVKV